MRIRRGVIWNLKQSLDSTSTEACALVNENVACRMTLSHTFNAVTLLDDVDHNLNIYDPPEMWFELVPSCLTRTLKLHYMVPFPLS